MKLSEQLNHTYQRYLDGKRSFDSVIDITAEWAAEVRGNALVPAPEVVVAEEAEARLRFERSRTKSLWEAYIQATHGNLTLDEVLDMAGTVLQPSRGYWGSSAHDRKQKGHGS